MDTYTIEEFGGIADGLTDNTQAFTQAISTIHSHGGGELTLTGGSYRTGSIPLCSNLTLSVRSGSVISFIPDPTLYKPVTSRWEGVDRKMHRACLYGRNLRNIVICGAGTIDGGGQDWWKRYAGDELDYPRPFLVSLEGCSNIVIRDLTFRNSPSWTLHPLESQDVLISNVTVCNPFDSPNTDGVDPESCSNVRILGCTFDVGDDCIAIKSGTEQTSQKSPCQDIVISGCNMRHGHGGVVLGSEMSGSIRNVVITSCIFNQTDRGIRMKTRRGRGGTIENIIASNIVMTDILCPLVINSYYCCGPSGQNRRVWDKSPYPIDSSTPRYRHIYMHDIRASKVRSAAAFIYGLPEMPIEAMDMHDVHISMDPYSQPAEPAMIADAPKLSQAGIYMENTESCAIRRVTISGLRTPAFIKQNANQHLAISAISPSTSGLIP